jgi:hypothetical protein
MDPHSDEAQDIADDIHTLNAAYAPVNMLTNQQLSDVLERIEAAQSAPSRQRAALAYFNNVLFANDPEFDPNDWSPVSAQTLADPDSYLSNIFMTFEPLWVE